jgi:4a-hydroxytetrahydrobiopterin dehydratase
MVKRLSRKQIQVKLKEIAGWKIRKDKFSGIPSLYKEFKFNDFLETVRFVRSISRVAEKYGHHPDIHLVRYNNLIVVIYTHLVHGLTAWDFELAKLIDRIKIGRRR